MVSTAAFHARARGFVSRSRRFKRNKNVSSISTPKTMGSLRDREIAYLASDLQGSNVWRAVSSHHPQEVVLAQFSLYVHKSGIKPDSRKNFTKCPKITNSQKSKHAKITGSTVCVRAFTCSFVRPSIRPSVRSSVYPFDWPGVCAYVTIVTSAT